MAVSHPPSPDTRDFSFLEPSEQFKKQVYSMIKGIVGFAALYIILILSSIGLAVACGYLGIGLIILRPMWFTIAAGLGIVALGIMVFLFFVKFIFAKTTEHDPQEVEIYERDYPELFAFIRQLTTEVKTDFPKRIFLVPDVNAAVLYNSSFWSMFLPIRKNLRIGLGLVNSLTVSEFRATLAHEFGHFSQRSMKLGSYVYTVNKVIYNLVNHRDSWDSTLEGWANSGGVFGFFAGITFWIVDKLRALLIFAYKQLNIRYLALSREMEYHADFVACSVAGHEPMIQTLRKIEFTDASYNYTLAKLNELAEQKKKTNNLYTLHQLITLRMAEQHNLSLVNNTPVITDADLEKHIIKSRLNIKDQWASHPSREEREKSINTIHVPVQLDTSSAWILFNNAETCMQQMTTNLYAIGLPLHTDFAEISTSEFIALVDAEETKNALPKVYKGFYDNRLMKEFDVVETNTKKTDRSFEELFHVSTADFFARHASNQNDLDQLKLMHHSLHRDDVFEFDNQKYKATDIPQVVKTLKEEVERDNEVCLKLDHEAFLYFHEKAMAQSRQQELQEAYINIFDQQKYVRTFGELIERLQDYLHRMNTQEQWTEIEISGFNSGVGDLEKHFKAFLKDLPATALESITDKDEFEKYNSGSSYYIMMSTFSPEGFQKLTGRMFEVLTILNQHRVHALKAMTEMQLAFIPEHLLVASRN